MGPKPLQTGNSVCVPRQCWKVLLSGVYGRRYGGEGENPVKRMQCAYGRRRYP